MNKYTLFIQSTLVIFTTFSSYGMESEEQTKMEIAKPFIDYLAPSTDLTDDSHNSIFAQCTAVAHHPHKPGFAIGTSSGNIHVWESYLDPSSVTTLSLFKNSIKHLMYNPQGTKLAVSYKNCLHIIKLATQKIIHTLKEKTDIHALVFDRDGRVLIYSTYRLPIGQWEPKTNTKLPTNANLSPSDWIIRSPNGKQFASKNQNKICMWKFYLAGATNQELTIAHEAFVNGAFVNAEGTKIITGLTNGNMYLWNKKNFTTTNVTTPLTTNKSITALAYCALIKKVLITTKEDPCIIYLDIENARSHQVNNNPSETETVESSVFNEDGTKLIQLINRVNKEDNSNTKFLRYTVISSGKEALPNYTIDQLQSMAKTFKE